MTEFNQWDIWMCKLPKAKGSVQQKIRPCVIVSNNVGNIFSNVIEVVAMTTQPKPDLPTHCTISAKTGTKILDSIALCEYPMPIPIENFLEKFGRCSEYEIGNIKECLMISLGL
jgi:mRNA interferase MazF